MANRRKSDLDKSLAGTLRSDRLHIETPTNFDLVTTMPTAPDYLGENGRTAWSVVCSQLIQTGRLTVISLPQVARYCEKYDHIHAARLEVERYGHFVEYPNGVRAANPALKLIGDTTRLMENFEKLFGLNPLASVAIPAPPPSLPVNDEFDII